MKIKVCSVLTITLVVISICLVYPSISTAQPFTIINGSIVGNGGIEGWDGVAVSGRENGAYMASVAYQTINSPNDPEASSGSALFTAEAVSCSLTQQLGFTAAGQTLTLTADIAWDGTWDYIYFGFYEDNAWDRMLDASIDITLTVPADTDGTLDDFHTVTVTGPLTNTGNPVRVFFGSSCDPYSGGAQSTSGPTASKFAIDNVTPNPPPPPVYTAAELWELYE